MGQEKNSHDHKSWQFRATEEIKLGQNEANSEDSSVLLQESMEKILRQIVNLYDTCFSILNKHWYDFIWTELLVIS